MRFSSAPGPIGDVQEGRHVVDGIVEAAGTLQSGAAAEVDESARHRRRPAPAAGAFEDEHVGTGPAASTAAAAPAIPYPAMTTSAS